MQKERNFFSGIKSVYFMLFACLTLSICATSCSSDEFETNLPEEQKQYTKAELIEQALSRMPQTRGENLNAVIMVTIENTVSFRCWTLDSMMIDWGDDSTTFIAPFSNIEHTHTYTDSNLSHYITLSGARNAIINLTVDNNELIFLNVSYNENLRTISCLNNRLDELISTGCSALQSLYIANNELSSLEVGHLSKLQTLQADHNLLTEIDVSKNSDLMVLWLGNNRLKDFDISKNLNMAILEIENNPIESIDLSEHMNLTGLNVSYTQITELDLSKSVNLQRIILEGLSIETFNNNLISDTSFAIYSQLWQLNVAYTPFTGLDLSNNPKINHIDISGTLITQLDISVLQIRCLRATRSKLTNLIWGENGLDNLFEIRIERTPFEDASRNMLNLLKDLPPRSEGDPGHLYTYAFLNLSKFNEINWLVNQ